MSERFFPGPIDAEALYGLEINIPAVAATSTRRLAKAIGREIGECLRMIQLRRGSD
jgi:hypothetical protein